MNWKQAEFVSKVMLDYEFNQLELALLICLLRRLGGDKETMSFEVLVYATFTAKVLF